MPLALTTITGTLYDVLGQPKQGVTLWIKRAVKSGLVILDQQMEAAVSGTDGSVSFTVPRNSTQLNLLLARCRAHGLIAT